MVIWEPATTQHALVRYVNEVRLVAALQDPSENGVEPPTHRNQNLPFAIARYLQTYPPGHPLYIRANEQQACKIGESPAQCPAHPLFFQFLNLPPVLAKRIIVGVLFVLALGLAWRMRRPWALIESPSNSAVTSALAPEWAVACAFVALLSPLTWLQHLTVALPCAYLATRQVIIAPNRARLIALGVVFVCTWILQRDPLPVQLSIVVMSYHEDVLAVLILIAMVLGIPGAIHQPELSKAKLGQVS